MNLSRIAAAVVALLVLSAPARANPAIVIDAASGEVLLAQEATRSWYPASLTKMMTAFVAMKAVRENRIAMNTPIAVSPRAARMPPSKMGFKPGQLVTLDNALKMLMVKSANDVAVSIAEGVSGSVEAFAGEMNAQARALGMRESYFVNPNGLPAAQQVTSARDMALLGRALYAYFPEHADLFGIGALSLNGRIIQTHNGMLGRYPGADGMKTGFTCSAGFNLVASATRGGRKLIVAVLGAPSATMRTVQAATLLDKVFAGQGASHGSVQSLASPGVGHAPDQRDSVCRNRGAAVAQFSAEIEDFSQPIATPFSSLFSPEGGGGSPLGGGPAQASPARQVAAMPRPYFEPVPVFVGPVPGWTGPIARAAGSSAPTRAAYAEESESGADTPLKPDARARAMKGARGKLAKHKAGKADVAENGAPAAGGASDGKGKDKARTRAGEKAKVAHAAHKKTEAHSARSAARPPAAKPSSVKSSSVKPASKTVVARTPAKPAQSSAKSSAKPKSAGGR